MPSIIRSTRRDGLSIEEGLQISCLLHTVIYWCNSSEARLAMVTSYLADEIEPAIMAFPDNNENENLSLRDRLTEKFVDYNIGNPVLISELTLSANNRSVKNGLTSLLDAYAGNGYFTVVDTEFV